MDWWIFCKHSQQTRQWTHNIKLCKKNQGKNYIKIINLLYSSNNIPPLRRGCLLTKQNMVLKIKKPKMGCLSEYFETNLSEYHERLLNIVKNMIVGIAVLHFAVFFLFSKLIYYFTIWQHKSWCNWTYWNFSTVCTITLYILQDSTVIPGTIIANDFINGKLTYGSNNLSL